MGDWDASWAWEGWEGGADRACGSSKGAWDAMGCEGCSSSCGASKGAWDARGCEGWRVACESSAAQASCVRPKGRELQGSWLARRPHSCAVLGGCTASWCWASRLLWAACEGCEACGCTGLCSGCGV